MGGCFCRSREKGKGKKGFGGERGGELGRKTEQRVLVRERIPESTERRGCREESRESFH